MFCSKCGNQLPNRAMFCSSCGTPVNIQPATPTEPVVPVAVEPAFTPAESVAPMAAKPAFTPSELVAPMVAEPAFTPSEPVAPITATPAFTPAEPVAPIVATPAFIPTEPVAHVSNNTSAPKKKSKTPIFIGLGIIALIGVIVAVVIIMFSDDKDNNSTASATEVTSSSNIEDETTTNETTTEETTTEETTTEEITTEETTTEEITTEEPTTENAQAVALSNLTTDFITIFKNRDYTNLPNYLIPGMVEYANTNGMTLDILGDDLAEKFYDPSNTIFLDYNVLTSSTVECDDTYYKNKNVDSLLNTFPEYKVPTAFAKIEVELSYKGQKSSIFLHFACVEDKYYFFSYDISNFSINFEGESESETESNTSEETTTPSKSEITEDDIKQMLSSNKKTIASSNMTGTNYQGEGFELTIPADWTQSGSTLVTFTSPTGFTIFNMTNVDGTLLSLYSDEQIVKLYYDSYNEIGATDIAVGTVQATNVNGYYITYKSYSIACVQYMFINADRTQMYLFNITGMNTSSQEYANAESAIASFKLK